MKRVRTHCKVAMVLLASGLVTLSFPVQALEPVWLDCRGTIQQIILYPKNGVVTARVKFDAGDVSGASVEKVLSLCDTELDETDRAELAGKTERQYTSEADCVNLLNALHIAKAGGNRIQLTFVDAPEHPPQDQPLDENVKAQVCDDLLSWNRALYKYLFSYYLMG